MDKDPNKRLGCKDKAEIKNHPFFHDIDFLKVLNKEYEAPKAFFDQTIL